jgi:hypothetical protein
MTSNRSISGAQSSPMELTQHAVLYASVEAVDLENWLFTSPTRIIRPPPPAIAPRDRDHVLRTVCAACRGGSPAPLRGAALTSQR